MKVRTGEDGRMVLETPSGRGTVTLGPGGEISVRDATAGEDLELLFGMLRARVRKMGKRFEVRTPAAVTSVRGTEYRVLQRKDGAATVEVLEGAVEVRDLAGRKAVEVPAGNRVRVEPGKEPGSLEPLPADRKDEPWEEAP